MNQKLQGELDAEERAKESVMLERLCESARMFFKDPKNCKAFEAWKNNKEDMNYGTNHVNG